MAISEQTLTELLEAVEAVGTGDRTAVLTFDRRIMRLRMAGAQARSEQRQAVEAERDRRHCGCHPAAEEPSDHCSVHGRC